MILADTLQAAGVRESSWLATDVETKAIEIARGMKALLAHLYFPVY